MVVLILGYVLHASATESMYGINFAGISPGTSLFLKERSQPKRQETSLLKTSLLKLKPGFL